MYEAYFGLSKRPFASVPQVEQYYPAATIEAARTTLARCIERAEGAGMIVGPSGTGKTLLCRMLAEQFNDSFEVVLLDSGRLSARRALLQAVLFGMGRPYRGMDEGELRLALVDYLTLADDRPQGMLLLVDEAHTLPLRLLEEIRMITNLVCGSQPSARLVLAGAAVLEERFASPKLESFSQRIVARCYLEALGRDETQAYIHAQIDHAGGDPEQLVPPEACQAVYRATDGVPRLINQVCDHALLLACAAGRKQTDPAIVEEAWADLQQLPTPWNGDSGEDKAGIIEFGGLDDEADQPADPAGAKGPGLDHTASVPMLRVAADSDETAPDPAQQVETIERALTDLDADFQPAGSIGPEVELVFEDPFSEEFQEEEAIGDHAERPRPSRHDEQTLEKSCAPREETQAQPPAALAKGEAEADDAAPEWQAGPETVPMLRHGPAREAQDGEAVPSEAEQMIIVEEGYDDVAAIHGPPARVRRQEYAQLFARLRRSS